MSTYAVVSTILVDIGIESAAVSDESYLRGDLRLDSTELVEVTLELKRRLGVAVRFPPRTDLRVRELCALVDDARAGQPIV